ncbi:MAG: sporulation integral membrane protein YtvI [Oscillospiraceae bacterium]|nr:sporulation integral membrane protein YtvI [Oscillospiraceae bacterium]
MTDTLRARRLTAALYFAAAAAGAYFFVRYAARWTLPFIVAFALSRAAEPLVRLLVKTARLPRAAAAGVSVALLFAAVIAVFALAVGHIVVELAAVAKDIPALLGKLSDVFAAVNARLRGYILAAPPEVQSFLSESLDGLYARSAELLSGLSRGIVKFLSGAAHSTPKTLVFLVTCAVSTFFISSGYGAITAFIMRQIPERRRKTLLAVKSDLRGTFGKWLKAQLMLASVTFFELLLLLFIIRSDYAALLALLIAVMDLFPVLGVGTALVPWGIAAVIGGNRTRGATLLAGFAVILLVRNILEPKFVGAQLGLPPLAALAAMYIGFCTAGITGMALFPILLIAVKRLNDRGIIKLWK